MNLSDLAQRIVAVLRAPQYQPLNKVELSKELGLAPDERSDLRAALRDLEERGEVARVRKDRYVLPEEAELVTGVIQIHANGAAHLLSEKKGQPDLYISAENVWTALPNDVVVARIISEGIEGVETLRGRRKLATGQRREGKVIRILKRATEKIVGTLQRTPKFFYVVSDDPRFQHDVYVHPGATPLPKPAQVGDKVVVRLDPWESRHINPEGEIIEVLGPASAPGIDMLSIVRKYSLPTEFPHDVLGEANEISEIVADEEMARRENLTKALIYTIDPDDARDFDDAIQVEQTGTGWRLGVHIADVSHYIPAGGGLDKEAYERGNSVYLADRVIPMLPERLSNGICSLKPNVPRLTRSVFIEFTHTGKMNKARFSRSVIQSAARLTYKQAFAILSGKTPEPLPVTVPDRTEVIPSDVAENVKQAWELASLLRRNRFAKGSLEMEFPEVKVWLDAEGKPVRLEKVENDISHQLIEEFMLAANEAVARETKMRTFPSIYRVHDNPAEEKLSEFRDLVRHYGYKVGDLTVRSEVQRLLTAIKQTPEEYALKIAFLRSLKRAAYETQPLGHYGLAKTNYTHFTSPIRRYADLVVHRVLGDIGDRSQSIAADKLSAVTEHISRTERTADDAERESVKLKKIEYFAIAATRQDRFEAVILDVRNYGLVIELPDFLISGLVHVSALGGDFYTFDAPRMRFIGRRDQNVYGVGDRIEVEVVKVDIFKQQIDFKPAPTEGGAGGKKGGKVARASAAGRGGFKGKGEKPAKTAKPAKPAKGRRFTKGANEAPIKSEAATVGPRQQEGTAAAGGEKSARPWWERVAKPGKPARSKGKGKGKATGSVKGGKAAKGRPKRAVKQFKSSPKKAG